MTSISFVTGGSHCAPQPSVSLEIRKKTVDAYGLVLSEEERRLTLRSLFKKRFEGVPVEGDRVAIGDFVLTLKETDGEGGMKWLGLKCPAGKGLYLE